MNNLIEVCHCGHAKDTHHDKGNGDCLGMGCNDCPFYRDSLKPDTLRRPHVRPAYHPFTCLCFECKRAAGAA